MAKSVRPELTGVQFFPLLVDKKMPLSSVPTKMQFPFTVKAVNSVFSGNPVQIELQSVPPSEEWKTPLYFVNAKILVPNEANAVMYGYSGKSPLPGFQLFPVSLEKKTPSVVPAKIVELAIGDL
jgi:hypothetical protein